MPNYVSNYVTLSGQKQLIKKVWEDTSESGFLNSLVPMPEDLRDTIKGSGDENQVTEYDGFTNWYDWAVSRWGTKWEVDMEGLEYSEDGEIATIKGWFDSAWSSPISAFENFSEENPEVQIQLDYNEPGNSFVGRFTYSNGQYSDEYFEYTEETSETVRDVIGEELDDFWEISTRMSEYEESL
jgi:hypothetical protein